MVLGSSSPHLSVPHQLSDNLDVVWGALIAFAIVVLLTPAVGGMARRLGIVDLPGGRRINQLPVPRLGGLALFLGLLVPALAFLHTGRENRGILLGAAIAFTVGLIDDFRGNSVDALIILGANPAYDAPAALDFAGALHGSGALTIHLGPYFDETASLCRWHLPETHPLEDWAEAARGMVVVALVVQPRYIHPLKFGFKVAAEFGLTTDVFTSETNARAWLAGKSPRTE